MFIDFFQFVPPLWSENDFVNMFGAMPSVFEKLVRTIVVYFVLVVVLRTFGKRKLSQLNPFDFVVLLLLSNTVQNAIIGNETTLPGGLIGAMFLIIISNVVVRLLYKLSGRKRGEELLDGGTTVLIKNGIIQKEVLEKESITLLELESVAHDKGFNSTKEIENCVLEPNGKFFVEAKQSLSEADRYAELIKKIEELSRQIAELRAAKT